MDRLGRFDLSEAQFVDPRGKLAPNPHLSGARGGHTINLHRFARDRIELIGRTEGVANGRLLIAGDLHDKLATVDAYAAKLTAEADQLVWRTGLDVPSAVDTDYCDGKDGRGVPLRSELHLGREGVSAVIWAGGLA
jgi:putative flavoprotein involved in K+ transport